MTALLGAVGLAVLLGIAWVFSRDRKAVDWKLVFTGLGLQLAFALVVLKVPLGRAGMPIEVAWPILFLASDAASYVSGQTFSVDGGPSMNGNAE